MNTLLLLGIGIVLLVMGHRYWGRLLTATVMRPARAGGGPVDPSANLVETGYSIAASGGVLTLFGVGLGLVWGWAPVFVWMLLGGSVLGVLAVHAHRWLGRLSPCAVDPAEFVLDRAAATACTVNWLVAGMLLVPVVALLLAQIVASYPEVLLVLAAQAVLAPWVARSRARGGGQWFAAVSTAFVAAPLGVAACTWLSPPLPGVVADHPLAIAMAALTAALVQQRYRRAESSGAFGASVAATLLIVLVVAAVSVAVQQPSASYPGYVAAPVHLPPLPLVVAVLFAGTLLLPPGGRRRHGERLLPRPAGATAEGIFATVILVAMLAAPGPDRAAAALPDWNGHIDPGAVAGYFIDSLDRLGVYLPLDGGQLALLAAVALAGTCWVLLENLVGAVRRVAAERLPAHPSAPLALDLLVLLLGAALCAAYGARGMPSWLWIVVGILGLQHGAGLLGIAAFANLRLKRPARALAAIALGFAGIAWWTGIDRAWTWALDGTAWIAVAAIAALLPATPGQLRLIRHWIALAGARRRQSMKIPQAS